MSEQAFYAEPTRRQRVMARLFPSRFVEAAFPEWAGSGDVIVVHAVTHFSWLDRLRIVLIGRVRTDVRVTCEHPAGRTVSVADSWPTTQERP
jgi:hypothetical protein